MKVKVKLSLWFIKDHGMKAYGGVEASFHAFLIFALDGDE
jgi:hypothetical protein